MRRISCQTLSMEDLIVWHKNKCPCLAGYGRVCAEFWGCWYCHFHSGIYDQEHHHWERKHDRLSTRSDPTKGERTTSMHHTELLIIHTLNNLHYIQFIHFPGMLKSNFLNTCRPVLFVSQFKPLLNTFYLLIIYHVDWIQLGYNSSKMFYCRYCGDTVEKNQ